MTGIEPLNHSDPDERICPLCGNPMKADGSGCTCPPIEPLFCSCEGSGIVSPGWCPMCALLVERGEVIPDHQRTDVLAMLARGDFDD